MTDKAYLAQMLSILVNTYFLTPKQISDGLGGRVSSRTIHRWTKGESEPQNLSDVVALQQFVNQVQLSPPPEQPPVRHFGRRKVAVEEDTTRDLHQES